MDNKCPAKSCRTCNVVKCGYCSCRKCEVCRYRLGGEVDMEKKKKAVENLEELVKQQKRERTARVEQKIRRLRKLTTGRDWIPD